MRRLFALGLSVALAAVLPSGVSGADEPYDRIIRNVNGVQQYLKIYTVSLDRDPIELVEAPFDDDGYAYSYQSFTKQENYGSAEKAVSKTVTVSTDTDDEETILAAFSPTLEYDDGQYSGTLTLDRVSIRTEGVGYETRSREVQTIRVYENQKSSDPGALPVMILEDGIVLPLTDVDWQVQTFIPENDALVPATYKAVATYSGRGYDQASASYVSTAEYRGTVTGSEVRDVTYFLCYVGTPIEASPGRAAGGGADSDPGGTETAERETIGVRTWLYLAGAMALILLLSGGAGCAAFWLDRKFGTSDMPAALPGRRKESHRDETK